ncbi:MAG: response regulator [Thermodesulfobacteriota bacterium]
MRKKSILHGKDILAVDDESDVLDLVHEELSDYGVIVERATSYEEAIEKMSSLTYDLAILDIMGVNGFALLTFAVNRQIPVVMLTGHAMTVESLAKCIELGARAYLPKYELGNIAPFLEDVLTMSYHASWIKLFDKLGSYFGKTLGPAWRKSQSEFLERAKSEMEVQKTIIVRD